MKVGVISDTHGLLRPEAVAALQGCEQIIHAGDIGSPEILEQLAQIAPLHVVRGNNDQDAAWAEQVQDRADPRRRGRRQADPTPAASAPQVRPERRGPCSDPRMPAGRRVTPVRTCGTTVPTRASPTTAGGPPTARPGLPRIPLFGRPWPTIRLPTAGARRIAARRTSARGSWRSHPFQTACAAPRRR